MLYLHLSFLKSVYVSTSINDILYLLEETKHVIPKGGINQIPPNKSHIGNTAKKTFPPVKIFFRYFFCYVYVYCCTPAVAKRSLAILGGKKGKKFLNHQKFNI